MKSKSGKSDAASVSDEKIKEIAEFIKGLCEINDNYKEEGTRASTLEQEKLIYKLNKLWDDITLLAKFHKIDLDQSSKINKELLDDFYHHPLKAANFEIEKIIKCEVPDKPVIDESLFYDTYEAQDHYDGEMYGYDKYLYNRDRIVRKLCQLLFRVNSEVDILSAPNNSIMDGDDIQNIRQNAIALLNDMICEDQIKSKLPKNLTKVSQKWQWLVEEIKFKCKEDNKTSAGELLRRFLASNESELYQKVRNAMGLS